jgi:predicted aldo/keto reductase-like oxidoreductase
MQYRIDERSGNKLSVLGFGCMRFRRGVGGLDFEKAEKLILRATSAGVNYFDTAYLYAGSETQLGSVLKKHDLRDKVYIATKLPIANCHSGSDFEKFWKLQLEALQTDYIDYYLMHNINSFDQWNGLCAFGIEEWLAEKKASGEIREIGFSFHGAKDEFIKVLDAYDWDFCQIQYNYANENYQAGVSGLRAAAEKHIPIIIMEPLLGGKLAKNMAPAAAKVFREANRERTLAAWGFRWLWNQPEVTVVLSGMNASEQLEDNIMTAETMTPGSLTQEELIAYDKVNEIFKATDKIPCTGCGYCVPCPQGVNIPGCFAAYNASFIHGRITSYTMYITGTAANRVNNSLASKCVKCGICESHCPQKIEIRKGLGDVVKRMEPFYFTLMMRVMRRRSGE